MSEEIKEEDALPEEEIEADEEAEGEGEPEENEKEEPAPEKKPPVKKKKGRKKWIILLISLLIIITAVSGIIFAPEYFIGKSGNIFTDPEAVAENDNLTEELLSPFFIPPVAGSSKGAVRIDLSAIWDGLSAIRYKQKEFRLRSRVYEYICDLAEENEDLNEKIPYLENELGMMFRQFLGAQNLVIKIKEIRYF